MYVWSDVFGTSTLFTIWRTFRCATFNDISEERECSLLGVSLSRVHHNTSHAALMRQPLSQMVGSIHLEIQVNYVSNGTTRIILNTWSYELLLHMSNYTCCWMMLSSVWISLQSLDLSPLNPVFISSGIWARVIYLTLLFWIRKWTSADSCDEWPYMWVCGCLFLYLDFMRTGWAGAICIQKLAIGGSHLQAMLSNIFRMTVHMVLLMFIFILKILRVRDIHIDA